MLIHAEADVDAMDTFKEQPMHYACRQKLLEMVHLLGDSGCSLYPEKSIMWHHRSILSTVMYLENSAVTYSSGDTQQVEQLTDTVIDLLVVRRQGLQDLFLDRTPPNWADEFVLCDDRILDGDADLACLLLKSHSVPIPTSLLPPKKKETVYHNKYLTVRVAESFWRAGFRDIDGRDYQELTPLMGLVSNNPTDLTAHLELSTWFLLKGASIYDKEHCVRLIEYGEEDLSCNDYELGETDSEIAAVHYMARHISTIIFNRLLQHPRSCLTRSYRQGPYLQSLEKEISSLGKESEATLAQILSDPHQDGCSCQCSQGGCRAILHTLKQVKDGNQLYGKLSMPELRLVQAWRFQLLECFIKFLVDFYGDADELWETLSLDIIRFLTFEALDLRHICCRRLTNFIVEYEDSDHIDEILEEDCSNLQLLEDLVSEFETKLATAPMPLLQFLKMYWKDRIAAVLQERDHVNEEPLLQIGIDLSPKTHPDDTVLGNNIPDDSDDKAMQDDRERAAASILSWETGYDYTTSREKVLMIEEMVARMKKDVDSWI